MEGGGESANFIFMGAGIFLTYYFCKSIAIQTGVIQRGGAHTTSNQEEGTFFERLSIDIGGVFQRPFS